MAKVGFIMFADEVFSSNPVANELMVKNPKIALTPEYIPGQFSFFVVFSLLDLREGEQYQLEIILTHEESGDEVLKNEQISFNFVKDKNNPVAEKINGSIINIHLNNIVFKKEGLYKFTIKIDGEENHQTINIFQVNGV